MPIFLPEFGDIPSSLEMTAYRSVRRNAAGTEFESYQPQTELGWIVLDNAGLGMRGITGSNVLTFTVSDSLSANRTLTFDMSDANREIQLKGDLSVGEDGASVEGTNTGDQTSIAGISGTRAQFDTACSDANFLYSGDVTQYTDEMAQDAVGGILGNTSRIALDYSDGTPKISADLVAGSVSDTYIASGIDAAKIGAGSVSNTEFGYLDGVTSAIQTQLNAKAKAGTNSDITSLTVLNYNGIEMYDPTVSYKRVVEFNDVLSADRTMTFEVGDASRTLAMTGNATISGTNTGDQDTFKTIAVSGQSSVVADSASDTLTLAAGSGITITTNATTDTVTIAAPGSGLTIGNAVSGGGANRVLYEDGSSNLAAASAFTYDGTTLKIGGSTTATHTALSITNGGYGAAAEHSIDFSDGTVRARIASYYAKGVDSAGFGLNLYTGSDTTNAAMTLTSEKKAYFYGQVLATSTTEQMRIGYDSSNYWKTTVSSNGAVVFDAVGSGAKFTFSDAVSLADGANLLVGSTTGTKIAEAYSDKLGFWGASPVVQPSTSVSEPTHVQGNDKTLYTNTTYDGYTLGQVVKALRTVGILA